MNAYEILRDACATLSDRGNTPMIRAKGDRALAALAELEKAAAEPVAWMWDDMLGISHTFVSPKRPTWPDAGASPEMAVAINVRPLYAAPPAPVAEIREVVVTDDVASSLGRALGCAPEFARGVVRAVQRELGPALGMVEIREPSDDECADIHQEWLNAHGIQGYGAVQNGRAMFNSVRAVMWPKEGL